jgi:DNA-binding SARP family transcriptional activator
VAVRGGETGPVRFRLLGGVAVSADDGGLPRPPPRLDALLGVLLLEPGVHTRDRLAELMRPDLPLPAARRRVSHLLWVLRTALPALQVDATSDVVAVPTQGRWTDVDAFRRAARGSTLASWRAAYRLYAGDLMPSCAHPWVVARREDLRQEVLALVQRACPALLDAGAAEEARRMAAQARSIAPLDEAVARFLMQAYTALGQRHRALAVFHALEGDIEQVGISPEEETTDLADRVRTGRSRASTPRSRPPQEWHVAKRAAHAAIDRGDISAARSSIERVRAAGSERHVAVPLLEADLAVAAGEEGFAAGLLAHCDAPQARLREAAMARRQGDLDQAWSTAVVATMETEQLGDQGACSDALTELAWIASARGEAATAASCADKAVQLAQSVRSARLTCRSLLARGGEELRQGQLHRAAGSLQDSADIAGPRQLIAEHGEALNLLAVVHRRSGRLRAAVRAHEASLRLWEQVGNGRGTAETLLSSARTHARAGHHARAVGAVKKALSSLTTERERASPLLADCQLVLGEVALDRCDEDAQTVLELSEHPVLVASTRRNGGQRARLAVLRGTALHLAGRHEAAFGELASGITLHESRGEAAVLPSLHALQALALLGAGALAESDSQADEALTLAATGFQEPDTAPLIYHAAGAVRRAQGRTREAERMLARGMAALERICASVPSSMAAAVRHRDPFSRALVTAAQAGHGGTLADTVRS